MGDYSRVLESTRFVARHGISAASLWEHPVPSNPHFRSHTSPPSPDTSQVTRKPISSQVTIFLLFRNLSPHQARLYFCYDVRKWSLCLSVSATTTGCGKYRFLDRTVSRFGLAFTQLKWIKRNQGCYRGFRVLSKVDSDIHISQTRVVTSGFHEFEFHKFLKRIICDIALLSLLIFTYVKHRATIDKFICFGG
jgi:hypothetical protein